MYLLTLKADYLTNNIYIITQATILTHKLEKLVRLYIKLVKDLTN